MAFVDTSVPRVYAIPFAWDTPDLLTGHEVYTPTVGDVLINAVINVTTLWDGQPGIQSVSITGTPDGGTFTLFGFAPLDWDVDAPTMEAAIQAVYPSATVSGSNPDFLVTGTPGESLVLDNNSLTGGTSPDVAIATTQAPGTPKADIGTFVGTTLGMLFQSGVGLSHLYEALNDFGTGILVSKAGLAEYAQVFPVAVANSLKLVVTNNGEQGGDDPGSTQGEAILYLVIATPRSI
jgi:hypothetical protein